MMDAPRLSCGRQADYRKIVLLYNVDVSHVEGAKLGQILETIANARPAD